MQVKKEKEIFLKTRHLHGWIAKSMPHTQPKQNVQSAKQKNKKKMQSLNFPKSLHRRMKIHHVEWNTMLNEALHKKIKSKVEWEKKGIRAFPSKSKVYCNKINDGDNMCKACCENHDKNN
jgi:hypothetical protein